MRWGRDALLAGVTAALQVGVVATAPVTDRSPDAYAYALAIGASLLLAFRSMAVPQVLAATVGALGLYHVDGYPGLGPAVPVLISAYTVARAGRRVPVIVFGLLFLGFLVASHLMREVTVPPAATLERWMLLVGWYVAASVFGEVLRQHQAYLDQVKRRAEEAERTREETAQRRAGEERLRIARELHDSLTHSISIVKVQAGVAVHLARKRGESVPEALIAIQEASTDAMRELRATLKVLRTPEDDTEPGSGLDRLEDLVERIRSAGLPTTVVRTGEPRPLPATVDRAAYRIVQEALTNVARHAGPATAEVHLDYGSDKLTVRVDDDGVGPRPTATAGGPTNGVGGRTLHNGLRLVRRSATGGARKGEAVQNGGGVATVPDASILDVPEVRDAVSAPERSARPAGAGVGLIGMRERVTALGGQLEAGARPGGGFSVQADLPAAGDDG